MVSDPEFTNSAVRPEFPAIPDRLLAAALALFVESSAFATWSVIAIDKNSGQVIIASATCVPQATFPQRAPTPARDLMDVQAVIVPGVGVAACQAAVDNTRRNQMLVFEELKKGTAPAKIIELLQQDPDIERRQFGILDVQGRAAGFSGKDNSPASLFVSGHVGAFYYFGSGFHQILLSESIQFGGRHPAARGRCHLVQRLSNDAPNDF
jgi:hypothetical protein